MGGLSRKGCRVPKPEDHLTLNAEDGEALRARVHRSNVPRADVERVEWVIRTYFYVVFALQEATLRAKRLRSLLFGKRPAPSPSPEASSAAGQAESDGPHASAVREAEAAGATGHQGPPGAAPRPARATPTGGHRPWTGCLGAAASAGATRVECRHAELAVGQRGPVCGQGPLSALPAGVEVRIDGHALLRAMRYELEKLRCSACGAILTAGLPDGVGEEQ
jgi:transposase